MSFNIKRHIDTRVMFRWSQLCGFHAALSHNGISQWLLAVCKSVYVGGVATFLSVHRVVFSNPVAHHPSQNSMQGIFLCLGCQFPNVAVVTNSLGLIMVWFLCQSPHRAPSLPSDCAIFRAQASVASVRFWSRLLRFLSLRASLFNPFRADGLNESQSRPLSTMKVGKPSSSCMRSLR